MKIHSTSYQTCTLADVIREVEGEDDEWQTPRDLYRGDSRRSRSTGIYHSLVRQPVVDALTETSYPDQMMGRTMMDH